MIFDQLYVKNEIIGSAMRAASLRNDVIVQNIANNDLPGYKRKVVSFEKSLEQAVAKYEKTGKLDLSDVTPTVGTIHDNLNYRIDKNNVDIDTEMVELYQNSVRYDALVSLVQNNSKRLSLVLTGR